MTLDADHHAALDKLAADAFQVGAQCGILEAIKLLNCRSMPEAADTLLDHWESVVRRAQTHQMAEEAIRKARAA